MQTRYGQHKQKLQIKQLLKDLPAQLPNLAERKYLEKALNCYESDARRTTVVMVSNLAYAHLCDHVVKNRLADFNARWQQDYKGDHKNQTRAIATVGDFADEELKEHIGPEDFRRCRDHRKKRLPRHGWGA